MSAPGKTSTWLSTAFGTLNVVMGALALAAVWAFAAMFTMHALAFAALLLGLGSGLLARMSLPQAPRYGTLLAAASTLLAAYYQQILMAAVRVTSTLGVPLAEALHPGGFSLLALLARLALHGPLLIWVLTGTALAALAAWPFNRRGS